MPTPEAAARLRFGRFELQADERRLLVDGVPAALGGRAFDLLLALAERPGRLVGKRELIELVWPGLVVQENNLAAQVSAVRKLLGGELIATVPGRGYRFVAPVEAVATSAPVEAGPAAVEPAVDRPVPSLRTNLPAGLPALLGRADDLAALAALVDAHRLVSVVGAGGIGKSLLAQHLLEARRGGAYPQGVCWVELAPLSDASALPGAIAAALGVDSQPGEPLAALLAAVAPLTLLLALDNAEHLLDAVASLCQALHAAAPGLRLLVTSQAPLRLPAERVQRIGPLAAPAADLPAAQARAYGAVALFVERAQALDTRFVLTDANAPAVIEVCRALDGLPLAIELAAARVALLGPAQLAAAMHERLRLLTASGNRGAPPRQRTLRAALEWSHALLAPREQQVFRRLAVMAGSASLVLVRQVVADPDPPPGVEDVLDGWAVLDALDALVERSLVALLVDGDADAPRYRLPESARAYALERLAAAGERATLQRRHAAAVADLFEAAYDDYFSGSRGADAWQRRLAADFDNARDALAWAQAAGDAALQLRIGATLLRALPPSLHAERMALADRCAAALEGPQAATLPEPLQQRAWLELSSAWADTQKLPSRAAAQRALALARRLDAEGGGDRFGLYHALCRAASAAAQAGALAEADAPFAELAALEDPAWPAQRLLWGTEAAQVLARTRGDRAEALRRSRRLLVLDRARGGDGSIAFGNLIDAELAGGDARGAAAAGAEFVSALMGTRHEYSLAYARLNLCAAWLALDDAAAARPVLAAAWPQSCRFELQHYAAAYLALLAALEARPRAAAALVGHTHARYTRRDEVLEINEAAALKRAEAFARAALGDAAFADAAADGARLGDAEVERIAFEREES